MKENADFRILYSGIFTEQDLQCTVIPEKRKYSPMIQKKINNHWQKRTKKSLFNGTVYSLVKSDFQNIQIHYWLQKTDYKSFYGTNLQNQFSEAADILAVCSVMETADGYILLGKRSEKLAESSTKWHVIGGSIDAISTKNETAFAAIRKEMLEETGISASDIHSLSCLGLGKNSEIQKPEFLFHTKLKISKQELETKVDCAKDKTEHTQFKFLPSKEIADFVASHPFSNIGKAAIHQYLHYKA